MPEDFQGFFPDLTLATITKPDPMNLLGTGNTYEHEHYLIMTT